MKKWFAGLLATVLSGVLIFWFTEGLREKHYGPTETNGTEQESPYLSQDEEWIRVARLRYVPIDDLLNRSKYYIHQLNIKNEGFSEESANELSKLVVETSKYAINALRESRKLSVSTEIISVKSQYESAMTDMVRGVDALSENRPDEYLYLLGSFNERMKIVDSVIGM